VRLAAGVGGVDVRADMMPTRRSTTPLPQATVGSGSNRPHLAACRLQVPDLIRLLLGPLPDTGSDSDVPDFWPVIRRGNAYKSHLPHTRCIRRNKIVVTNLRGALATRDMRARGQLPEDPIELVRAAVRSATSSPTSPLDTGEWEESDSREPA